MYTGRTIHSVLYQLPNGAVATRKQLVEARDFLIKRLLVGEPPKVLVNRYVRSHPLVSQRLNARLVRRCAVAASNSKEVEQLDAFVARLPELQLRLQALPLAFVNPEMVRHAVWIDAATQQPTLLNWGHWSLEPVGAAWPVGICDGDRQDMLSRLEKALLDSAQERPGLQGICLQSAKLAALAYALEKACQRQQFDEALVLAERVLNAF